MLVIRRKAEEALMIGDDVEIKVLEVHEGRVKLGIAAPRSIAVHRLEVWRAIQATKRGRRQGEASGSDPCGEQAAALGSDERRVA